MGFEFKQYQRGIYIDGHERDDVVEYRKEFLAKMKELVLFMNEICLVCSFVQY